MRKVLLAVTCSLSMTAIAGTDYQCVNACTSQGLQYPLCVSKCSWDDPKPSMQEPFGLPARRQPQPLPAPLMGDIAHPSVATPVSAYLEGRRMQQEYQLMELERQRRELELEQTRQRMADENSQRQLQEQKQAKRAEYAQQPKAAVLACTFSGEARDNTPAHALVKSSYKPDSTVLVQVSDSGLALRGPSGWTPVPSDLREDAFQAQGQFLSRVERESQPGAGSALPDWSLLVVDRYSGIAVIFTHPDAAHGADVPMFPGECRLAERQF